MSVVSQSLLFSVCSGLVSNQINLALAVLFQAEGKGLFQSGRRLLEGEECLMRSLARLALGRGEDDLKAVGGGKGYRRGNGVAGR